MHQYHSPSHEELTDWTSRHLRERRDEPIETIGDITRQIEQNAYREETVPGFTDTDWRARAIHARAIRQTDLKRIEAEIEDRAELRRQYNQKTIPFYFVEVAQRRLPPAIWEEIHHQAELELTRPDSRKDFEAYIQKRERRRKRAIKQIESRAQQQLETESETSNPSRLAAAEQVCRTAQFLIEHWKTGQAITADQIYELEDMLDAWRRSA